MVAKLMGRAVGFAVGGAAFLLAAETPAWSVVDGVGTASGTGTVNLEETTALSALNLAPDAGDLVLTGSGLAFTSAAATIKALRGSGTTFNVPVTAAGGLTLTKDAQQQTVAWANDGFLTTSRETAKTLFTNRKLSEYTVYGGIGGGYSMTSGRELAAFYPESGDGWLTVQLQAVDGGWAKCVKVRLEQSGSDIVGWAVYAKYLPSYQYGEDYDVTGNNQSIATSEKATGYGVTGITLWAGNTADFTARFTQPVRLGGTLDVEAKTCFRADGENVLAADGVVTNAIALNGILAVTNALTTVFSNAWSGSNGTLLLGGYATTSRQGAYTNEYAVSSPGGEWQLAAENAYVSALTNVIITAYSGKAIDTVPNPDGQTFHLRTEGGMKVCQCQQVAGAWIKCPYLQFRQNGKNVEVKLLKAYYTAASTGRGVDFDTLPIGSAGKNVRQEYTATSNPGTYGYGVGGFILQFDQTEDLNAGDGVRTEFAAPNGLAAASVIQHGGTIAVTDIDGLPASGSVEMYDGTLELAATGCAIGRGISYGKASLYVTNGILSLTQGQVIDSFRSHVVLDASELRLKSGTKGSNINWTDGNNYVNDLELRNGSRVTGASPRLLYSANATWKVTGTGMSRSDVRLTPASTGNHTITFNVADTTGDASTDFLVVGGIRSYDLNEHYKWSWYKQGAGTLELAAACTWVNPAHFVAGVVAVSAKDVLPAGGALSFDGGTLALAANTTNATGVITVAANSEIDLGEGAVLQAADASGQTWTDGATLAVNGPFVRDGARTGLRFGTAATLTAAQLKAIRYNDYLVRQDGEGWIRTGTRGTLLTLQ